jgi:hypothetical protein
MIAGMTQNVADEAGSACSIVSHPPKIAAGWGSLSCSDAKLGQPPIPAREDSAVKTPGPDRRG